MAASASTPALTVTSTASARALSSLQANDTEPTLSITVALPCMPKVAIPSSATFTVLAPRTRPS